MMNATVKKVVLLNVVLLAAAGSSLAFANAAARTPRVMEYKAVRIVAQTGYRLVSEAEFEKRDSGGMGPGDVLIQLEPRPVQHGRLIVDYSMNTHSVNLSQFDLKEITELASGDRIIAPVEATRPGGHHSSGKIVFDIGEDIRSFTITIRGIPEEMERVFEWNTEPEDTGPMPL